MRERTLRWEGCLNVRDLGGHATEDGGETLWGRVIRADSVHSLTDKGGKRWPPTGSRTVVDLRSNDERADDASGSVEVDVVHVSVLAETGDPVYAEIRCRRPQPSRTSQRQRRVFYLEVARRWSDRFAAAVAASAAARPGGVVIHCHCRQGSHGTCDGAPPAACRRARPKRHRGGLRAQLREPRVPVASLGRGGCRRGGARAPLANGRLAG